MTQDLDNILSTKMALQRKSGINMETYREARCTCGQVVPSSESLAFFESTIEGTYAATESCANCGYSRIAHEYGGYFAPPSTKKNHYLCLNFNPPKSFESHGPWDYDRFYCGHAGWD